jgi:hypothetical protein
MEAMVLNIHRPIAAFYASVAGEHHRYRSWEYCYAYFRRARLSGLARDRDHAALQLAFYLASWGMYRGSSFLLQHAYTIHCEVIDVMARTRFDRLWDADFGASDTDDQFMPQVRELVGGLKKAYKPFVLAPGSAQPTDTLITKVILGTFGCLPACDRYFIDGFKSEGFKYSRLNDNFVGRVLRFCREHLDDLRREQASIEQSGGIRYPLMKLVDMYFWQIGYEMEMESPLERGGGMEQPPANEEG